MINKWEIFLSGSCTSALSKSRVDSVPALNVVTVVLITLLTFIPWVVNAQEATDSDSVEIQLEAPISYSVNTDFSSSLNFSDYASFGDISLEEVLIRIPGVQASRDGKINFRGVGYNSYGVAFNGLRLANTGLGTRNIDPGNISMDVIQSMEVTKVLDPSMSADAFAGLINLNTNRVIPAGEKRTISALVGGQANTKYNSRTGPGSRAWIHYAESFSDELAVSINLGYHQALNSVEELQIDFGTENFGNGVVDVFDRVSPSVNITENGRFTSSADVYFTPDEVNSYFFKGYFNSNDQVYTTHQDSWITGGDWIDQSTTGAQGELGSFSHEAGMSTLTTSQFAFQAGGEHEMDSYTLSYNAGWTQGRADNRDYLFPFQIDELNYALDLSEKNRPQFEFTNREVQILDDGTVDRQFMIGQDFDRTVEEHVNNEIAVRADLEFPISTGALKTGLSSRWSSKEGEYDENRFEYNRTLRMISFNMLREPNRNIDVINDAYNIPWFVNTENGRAFFESQRPLFTGDDNYAAYQSEIRNYTTDEQIYAGYAMADVEFGGLEVKAGARVEYAITDLVGNSVSFNEDGDVQPVAEQEESKSAFHLFPNLQINYGLTEQNNIKAAYSRTIDRPDYYPQTPFTRIDNQDSTTFSGDHLLEAVTSENFDLMFQQRTGNSGFLKVGGFYKLLNNFIEQQQVAGQPNTQYEGYQRVFYANSNETATVYGVEVAVDQRLNFLSGFLRNMGVYANYTWSQSSYRSVASRDKKALTGHSPHVLNGALSYTLDRFKAQVSYHWSSEALTRVASGQQVAPEIAQGNVYLDQYEDGYEELSVTASYELSSRFSVWANANHMLSSPEIEYLRNRSAYPKSTYIRSGFDLRVGVRFDI